MRTILLWFFGFLFSCFCVDVGAQMQGTIGSSSERTLSLAVSDSKTVRIERLDNNRFITLCKLNNGRCCFVMTTTGSNNVIVAQTSSVDNVYNFRVFEDFIFFCGNIGSKGYVAFASVEEVFNGGGFQIRIFPTTSIVHDLQVYKTPTSVKVSAIAYNHQTQTNFLWDWDVFQNVTSVQAYRTPNYLHCLTQTDKYIAAVGSVTDSNRIFSVTRYDKGQLSSIAERSYRYAFNAFTYKQFAIYNGFQPYVVESSYNQNKIFVSSQVEGGYPSYVSSNPGYSIAIFKIDLFPNLSIDTTRLLITSGKPQVKSMRYNPLNDSIYLLANTDNIIDLVYSFPFSLVLPQSPSMPMAKTIPNNSESLKDKLNAMMLYDYGRYYIVAGVDGANNLYWFDRKFSGTTQRCYSESADLVFDDPTVYDSISMGYVQTLLPVNEDEGNFTIAGSSYILNCFD